MLFAIQQAMSNGPTINLIIFLEATLITALIKQASAFQPGLSGLSIGWTKFILISRHLTI